MPRCHIQTRIKSLPLGSHVKGHVISYTPSTTILSLFLFTSGELPRIYVGLDALVPPILSPSAPTFLTLADPTPGGVTSARIHGLALAPGCCRRLLCCLEILICRAIETSTGFFPVSASSTDAVGAWLVAGV